MGITYAGQALLLGDPEHVLQEWLDRCLALDDLRMFSAHMSLTQPAAVCTRNQPRSGASSHVGLALPNWPAPPRPKINTLWWPVTGASRWAVGFFITNTAGLTSIRSSLDSNNKGTLSVEANGQTVTAEMFLLQPRKLTANSDDCLWLLPLVDKRYFFQFLDTSTLKSALANNDTGTWTTWATLLAAIAAQVPGTFTYPAVPAAYKYPDPTELTRQYENLGVLLDAVATNVGMRVVASMEDDDLVMQEADTAAEAKLANDADTTVPILAGGTSSYTNSLIPEKVQVTFQRAQNWSLLCDANIYSITKNASDIVSGIGRTQPVGTIKTFFDTAVANWGDNYNNQASDPANKTELDALALEIATDYYSWLSPVYDTTYSGLFKPFASGYDDAVWYHVGYQFPKAGEGSLTIEQCSTGEYACFTRLNSLSADWGVVDLNHQVRSVAELEFYNGASASESVPQYGVMAVAGVQTIASNKVIPKVEKPGATPRAEYLVNDSLIVATLKTGTYQHGEIVRAIYDSGTPALDEFWIPKSGQWSLTKGKRGDSPWGISVIGIIDSTNKILVGKIVQGESQPWYNGSSAYECPAYGVAAVTGVHGTEPDRILQGDRPLVTIPKQYIVNTGSALATQTHGLYQEGEWVLALYETGTPILDEVWIPKKDQWSLVKGSVDAQWGIWVAGIIDSTNKILIGKIVEGPRASTWYNSATGTNSTCPAYGIAGISGVEGTEPDKITKGAKPTGTYRRNYLVNSDAAVETLKTGAFQNKPLLKCLYSDTDDTPALGEMWTPTEDQWYLTKGKTAASAISQWGVIVAGPIDTTNKILLGYPIKRDEIYRFELKDALTPGGVAVAYLSSYTVAGGWIWARNNNNDRITMTVSDAIGMYRGRAIVESPAYRPGSLGYCRWDCDNIPGQFEIIQLQPMALMLSALVNNVSGVIGTDATFPVDNCAILEPIGGILNTFPTVANNDCHLVLFDNDPVVLVWMENVQKWEAIAGGFGNTQLQWGKIQGTVVNQSAETHLTISIKRCDFDGANVVGDAFNIKTPLRVGAWTDLQEDDIVGYLIEKGGNGTVVTPWWAEAITFGKVQGAVVNQSADTALTVSVKSCDSDGNNESGPAYNVNTPVCPPGTQRTFLAAGGVVGWHMDCVSGQRVIITPCTVDVIRFGKISQAVTNQSGAANMAVTVKRCDYDGANVGVVEATVYTPLKSHAWTDLALNDIVGWMIDINGHGIIVTDCWLTVPAPPNDKLAYVLSRPVWT